MNLFIENYAHLIVIAAPVLTLAAMNLFLVLGGERGTLLLPSSSPVASPARAVNLLPARAVRPMAASSANDPDFRSAA